MKANITRRMLIMKMDGCRRTERPNKIWMDCVRNDICIKSLALRWQQME